MSLFREERYATTCHRCDKAIDFPVNRSVLPECATCSLKLLGAVALFLVVFCLTMWAFVVACQHTVVPWLEHVWRDAVRDACKGGGCR